MESNHRTRRNGFTVRRVWPLRYPCNVMTPSLRARAPPIVMSRNTSQAFIPQPCYAVAQGLRIDRDSNPGTTFAASGFQDQCFRPLSHLSIPDGCYAYTAPILNLLFFTDAKSNVHGVRILRERDSNPQPSAYETDELTIATISQ